MDQAQRFTVHYQHGTNTYRINDAVEDVYTRTRYVLQDTAQRVADGMNNQLKPWAPPGFLFRQGGHDVTGETPTVYLTIMQSSTPTPTIGWIEALALAPYLDNPEVWSWLEKHGALNRNTLTWVHVSTNSDPTPVVNGGTHLALTVPVSERDALDAAISEGSNEA